MPNGPDEHTKEVLTEEALAEVPGEFEFIERLRQRAGQNSQSSPHNQVLAGIGDDAAIIRSAGGKDTVVATDLLVEDIDFRRNTIPAFFLGHKALTVSLSDIAAMGARPRWCLTSIGLPEDVWHTEFLDSFYDGVFELARLYDVQLVGGDTSRTSD